MTSRQILTWLGWVLFFFAWGFVIHGAGLVLHEVAGHGVAAMVVGCGTDRVDLTYFGHGQALLTPCTRWTLTGRVILDWAGLGITISTGAVAMALQRRARLLPLTRLLVALLATSFLLSQLAYTTSGGFHEVYDPGLTAVMLRAHGLRVLAWLPPLVLFAASALFGARAIVDAFRVYFRSRSRLHTLKQMAATLGGAGLLYFIAFRIESALRTDLAINIAVAIEERAALVRNVPRFPIHRVLLAIEVAAFALALARPVVRGDTAGDSAPPEVPRRYAIGVGIAALVCIVVITCLTHLPAARGAVSMCAATFCCRA